jgi:hypothetical protein
MGGEPDLTALVIEQSTGLPGTFAGKPVIGGTASEARWRNELERIRGHVWK